MTRISWTDVNNAQKTGRVAFRDGWLTIDFIEIATWKRNPRATFRLMRKNLTEVEPQYVLGEQLDDREPDTEGVFYTSSNGDTWTLVQNETGEPAVMHVPNPSSGGQPSQMDVSLFLSNGAEGPEHQALRHLMEKTDNATILIAYDVHPAQGAGYDALVSAIQSLGAWWHHLETVWIVQSNRQPSDIRNELQSHIGSDDQLLILDITGDKAGWAGVSETGSEWLRKYVAV
jgi:hypothetical protein